MNRLLYIHLLLATLCLLGCESTQEEILRTENLYSADSIVNTQVGQQSVTLSEEQCDNYTIILTGLHGQITLSCEEGKLFLPELIANIAGSYQLLYFDDHRLIEQQELRIKAGKPEGEILTYVGPKTTSFDGTPGTMLTTIITDSLNNMVDDDIALRYRLLGKKGRFDRTEIVDHNYFTKKIFPPYNNDKVLVGLAGPNLYSLELPLEGSSGCAKSAELTLPLLYPLADGRQTFDIEVQNGIDSEGYKVEDGSLITLYLYNSKSSYKAKYTSVFVNGGAKFTVENPPRADIIDLDLYACEQLIASKRDVVFNTAAIEVPHIWLSATELQIGPVLNTLNQVLPNGSPIDLSLVGCEQATLPFIELYDGIARIDLNEIYTSCDYSELVFAINNQSTIIKKPKSNE